jgi:hypothetical protein
MIKFIIYSAIAMATTTGIVLAGVTMDAATNEYAQAQAHKQGHALAQACKRSEWCPNKLHRQILIRTVRTSIFLEHVAPQKSVASF